jgi:hypothetical protein
MKQRITSIDEFVAIFETVNEMASPKDLQRIEDIIKKANGNAAKEVALAQQMVNSITDKQKSLQRFEAAMDLLGKDHDVTKIFAEKAKSLGNSVDLNTEVKKEKTLGKLGSEDSDTKSSGRDAQSGRPSPILPIGSVNLASGSCKYFDIYSEWGKSNKTTMEVWKIMGTVPLEKNAKYKLIFTSGSKPSYKIGSEHQFIHDQTHSNLFWAEMVDWANIGDADLVMKKYGKSISGYVYK